MYTIRTNFQKGKIDIPNHLKQIPDGTQCLVIFQIPASRQPSFHLLYSMGDRAVPAIQNEISDIDKSLSSDPHMEVSL